MRRLLTAVHAIRIPSATQDSPSVLDAAATQIELDAPTEAAAAAPAMEVDLDAPSVSAGASSVTPSAAGTLQDSDDNCDVEDLTPLQSYFFVHVHV